MNYTISELSKMFKLPTSTIRYYEKIGLLENVEHTSSKQRVYNESHVERLHAIECFKKALLPLESIKTFFAYEKNMIENSDKILNMMYAQEQKTKEAIENLESGFEHLQRKIRYYSLVNEAVKTNTSLPIWNDV